MHILFLPSWYPDERHPGNGVFFREQALALAGAGYKIGVLASTVGGDHGAGVERYGDNGIEVIHRYSEHRLGRMPLGTLCERTRDLCRSFEQYLDLFGRPDLLHVQSAVNTGAAAFRIRADHGIPYVITEHYTGFARGVISPWHLAILKVCFRRANSLAVVSPSLGEVLGKRIGGAADGWRWVPNMVDPMFTPGESARNNERFTFLNIAGLHEKKGHADLLEAFAAAFRNDDSTELIVGGEGDLRGSLESMAVRLGVSDRVRFVGQLSRGEVLRWMRACDAFVLSSHFETFGVVIIEAMACGKPCVATVCGGPEHILDDETGLLVPPRSAGELASAMASMRRSRGVYDPVRIRRKCLDRFSSDRLVQNLGTLYERALHQARRQVAVTRSVF